jgi:hypothetical protein
MASDNVHQGILPSQAFHPTLRTPLTDTTYPSSASNTYYRNSRSPQTSLSDSTASSTSSPTCFPAMQLQEEPQAIQPRDLPQLLQFFWNSRATSALDPQGVLSDARALTSDNSRSMDEEEFQGLCSNYLNMLSQDEQDMAEGCDPLTDAVHESPAIASHDATLDVRQASDFDPPCSPLKEDFLTSPFGSPPDEVLVTPALDFEHDSPCFISTSPVVESGQRLLFGEGDDHSSGVEHLKDVPAIYPLDGLTSWAEPDSPPATVYPSPTPPSYWRTIPSQVPVRRRTHPTGTRPGLTPDDLISIDAPTTQRRYSVPSSTAKKVIPKFFERRKRARSIVRQQSETVDGNEQDPKRNKVDHASEPQLDPTDAELIEAKRRQNTEAARRSRKRKLEYQQGLEMRVEVLERERDTWKTRALMAEVVLKHQGFELPVYSTN